MIPASSAELAFLILAIEFGVLALGLTVTLLRRARPGAPTQTALTTALGANVHATPDVRREALMSIMRDTYQFEAAETEHVLGDFLEREHAFYSALLAVHLGRGGQRLADAPNKLLRVVAPWLRLIAPSPHPSEDLDANAPDHSTETEERYRATQVIAELMREYQGADQPAEHAYAPNTTGTQTVADAHDLLSLDESLESPEGVHEARELRTPGERSLAVAPFDDSGEFFALDGDPEERVTSSSNQVTPTDLDLLMENLDADYPQQSAAA